MSDQNQGIASELYKDTASLGEFMAMIILVSALFFSTLLILTGISAVMSEDPYLYVTGTVVKSECAPMSSYDLNGRQKTSYKCSIVVEYTVNNAKYSKQIFSQSSESYMVGESVRLSVDKRNHNNASLASMSVYTSGSLMICGGIFFLGLAYFNYYVTYNYKAYAAGRGVGSIINIFRGAML